MIQDTTSFKGVLIPRTANAPDAATEHIFENKMQQVLIQQAVLHTMKDGNCLERVMTMLMEYLAIPLPWHPDQAHLAEWQAFSTREILFNIDQSVEARNMAQKQAAKHKSMVTKDGDNDEGTMCKPKIVIEDLGGAPADLDDEDHPEDATLSRTVVAQECNSCHDKAMGTLEVGCAGSVELLCRPCVDCGRLTDYFCYEKLSLIHI